MLIPHFVGIHTGLEATTVVISLMIFLIQFVLRKYSPSSLYQILGVPFLGVGALDLLHMFSYRGMPDFVTPNDTQKSISFWLAARILEALTFANFAWAARLNWHPKKLIDGIYLFVFVYAAAAAIIILGAPEFVPRFTDDAGRINELKVGIEYALMLSHLGIFFLLSKPAAMEGTIEIRRLLSMASLVIAVSGLCFSSFANDHDVLIFVGHVLKVVAYYFIFSAALKSELVMPYLKLMELSREVQTQSETLREFKSRIEQSERLNSLGMSLSAVLHDLNNMLTLAEYSTQKILELVSVEGSAQKIQAHSKMLLGSIERTHGFQRLLLNQASGSDLEKTEIDLENEFAQFERLLRALAGGNNALVITCEPGLKIFATQVELEQILMNLVVNARDAIRSGSGRIEVSAARRVFAADFKTIAGTAPAGEYIEISVADNGVGIPSDILPKIFEPFFTTKTEKRGTGLGLSTVRDLVQKWNGQMTVASRPDEGTRVSIFVPLSQASERSLGRAAMRQEPVY